MISIKTKIENGFIVPDEKLPNLKFGCILSLNGKGETVFNYFESKEEAEANELPEEPPKKEFIPVDINDLKPEHLAILKRELNKVQPAPEGAAQIQVK